MKLGPNYNQDNTAVFMTSAPEGDGRSVETKVNRKRIC